MTCAWPVMSCTAKPVDWARDLTENAQSQAKTTYHSTVYLHCGRESLNVVCC